MLMRMLVLSFLVLMVPVAAAASESCSMMGGTCRDECASGEVAEAGAFDDCRVNQECCVALNPVTEVRCCVGTFDSAFYGPGNCSEPVDGACASGAANAAPCSLLMPCRERSLAPPPKLAPPQ
jgi:hypothetical protein